MEGQPPTHITKLLQDWSRGDRQALDELMPVVYQELRKLANSYLRAERPDHTLQPTALIHEVYLRLIGQNMPEWESRAHFFGVAARLMRQILIDHARGRNAERRGGPHQSKILLEDTPIFTQDNAAELLAFDEALRKLAELDERKAQIIEMRSFAGMSVEETARALNISEATIKREMRLAKAWLMRELRN
ncbi:MAG TPA: sigma-70 family RNA polymerase sigma factor [Acidobacteriota bacterium]|nr:sigma-70 family RNA polymerase sigma factor [Acidobacteriota bacterium]